jgi:hypothetical protein
MGATFNDTKIRGPKAEVEIKFKELQEQDRYENGHSYSGGFGMASGLTFTDKVFANDANAREWLADNHQKWENALAVRVGDPAAEIWIIGAWCSS